MRTAAEVDSIAATTLRSAFSSLLRIARSISGVLLAAFLALFTLSHWVELFALPRAGLAAFVALSCLCGVIAGYLVRFSEERVK